jgi:hypothetical protein
MAERDRRLLLLALVGALGTHLVVFFAAVILLLLSDQSGAAQHDDPPPTPPPPAIVLIEPSMFEQIPEPPERPKDPTHYLRTTQNTASDVAPEDPSFISDRDTIASSRLPPDPSGDPSLANTQGITLPTNELIDRDDVEGEPAEDAALPALPSERPAAPQQLAQTPPPAPEPPAPEHSTLAPAPDPIPTPVPPDSVELALELAEDGLPEPVEEPVEPVDAAEMAEAHGSAQQDPPQERSPEPEAPELVRAEPVDPSSLPPSPDPTPPAPDPIADSFQPETRTQQREGAARLGPEDALNAVATPAGRYSREVFSAIERRLTQLRRRNVDAFSYGSVRVRFYVNRRGEPSDLEIVFQDATTLMTDLTLTAVLEAQIPPMPDDLPGDRQEITYNVIVY